MNVFDPCQMIDSSEARETTLASSLSEAPLKSPPLDHERERLRWVGEREAHLMVVALDVEAASLRAGEACAGVVALVGGLNGRQTGSGSGKTRPTCRGIPSRTRSVPTTARRN